MTEQHAADPAPEPVDQPADEGPGWMPAILAGTLLMAIIGFLFCGFSTWILFQKRTELAIRTLRGSYLPALEQSLLAPEDKRAVVQRIETLAMDMERGKFEDWQAAAVMQRLQRLPVLQWGELAAVEAVIAKSEIEEKSQAVEQLSRLRRAVELGKVTSFDVEDALQPVLVDDENALSGRSLVRPMEAAAAREVVHRAKLLADRSGVPDQSFEVDLDQIIQREIDVATQQGGY